MGLHQEGKRYAHLKLNKTLFRVRSIAPAIKLLLLQIGDVIFEIFISHGIRKLRTKAGNVSQGEPNEN